MFHNKSILSACLAILAAFLVISCTSVKDIPPGTETDSAAPVEATTPVATEATATAPEIIAAATPEAAPVEAKSPEATPVETKAATPAPVKPGKKASATGKNSTKVVTESPEDLKLRSGPGNPVAGLDKAELCTGCHGEDGNSMDGLIPKLAGQYGKYISKQVRNYQSGIRTHQIMGAVAASISDDELADIAAFFGSQQMMKGESPSTNTIGKALFENGDLTRMMVPCNNCHGATGKGQNPRNPAFPVIGGQHRDYLRGQILNFRKGDRNNSPGGVMNIIVQKLTDAEVEALAEYISGL